MSLRFGIDVGGTFTDVVCINDGALFRGKADHPLPGTPELSPDSTCRGPAPLHRDAGHSSTLGSSHE